MVWARAALAAVVLGGLLTAAWYAVTPAQPEPGRGAVRVAAAADLKFAFEPVAAAFHARRPDVNVTVTYGSSGNLFAQLTNRAPFDLFLSADSEYPRRLAAQGQADADTFFVYAIGHLVLLLPKAATVDLDGRGAEVLLDPSVKKIALANPAYAPYGRAAEAALKSLGLYDKVKARLILGENVAQAAHFLHSGTVDAALVPQSLACVAPLRDETRAWPVPPADYPRIEQGGVILSWAQDREAAAALRGFLMGADGQALLRQYGFAAPRE